jgi:hypothetical protein
MTEVGTMSETTTAPAPWMSAPVKVPVWALLVIGGAIAGSGGAVLFGSPIAPQESALPSPVQQHDDSALLQRISSLEQKTESIERRTERIESLLMQMQK